MEKRPYDNRRREETARQTRRAIVAVGRQLFVDPGYGSTRMSDIAAGAGVGVATVHALFGTKRGLLSAVLDQAIAGDDDATPLAGRSFVADINALPGARDKLARYATHLSETLARIADLQLALQAAATIEPDVAEIWQKNVLERRSAMGMFAGGLITTGELRPELSHDQVTDVLWLAMDALNYDYLVRRRGWTSLEFESWYVDSVAGSLLLGQS